MLEAIVILIPGLPFLAAMLNGFSSLTPVDSNYHQWYKEHAARLIAFWATTLSFFGALGVLIYVIINPEPREVIFYQWITSGNIKIEMGFLIDRLSAFMMVIATIFPVPIARFATNYFQNEKGMLRFFTIKPLMLSSLLLLVMGNNYLVTFLGWELVGVCMALMIGYHYERKNSVVHGNKAAIMGRIGDVGFLLAILIAAMTFGTLNYMEVFDKVPDTDPALLVAIALCLLIAAMAKSAQLPFSTWLATAMEGPTPASALIHAAVQDGVYLIARNFQIFDHAPNVLLVVAIVGAVTALFAGIVGLVQTHIKGVLAYSTISQLGLMFLACGMGAYAIAVFHMLTHAAVKTYLFLTSPSIIHHLHGRPNLKVTRPIKPTGYAKAFSNIALIVAILLLGFPLISGWWPGQSIVGVELASSAYILLALIFMGWFTTIYYSRRLVIQSFAHGNEEHLSHLTGRNGLILKPMLTITGIIVLAFVLGLLPGGSGGGWFQSFLGDYNSTINIMGYQSATLLPSILLGLMLLIVLFAWIVGLYFDRFQSEVKKTYITDNYRRMYITVLNVFWIDEYFNRYIVTPITKAGRTLDRFDSECIDRFIGLSPLAAYQHNNIFLSTVLQKVSEFFSLIEFKVFRGGVNNSLLAFMKIVSNIFNWLEVKIFNQLINEGITSAVLNWGSILENQENKLDRPRIIIFISILFFSTFIIWIFG